MQLKMKQWLVKRFQADQFKVFKQRDVFVFLHTQSVLYVVLIVITFIAGINYANNLILGFCFLISSILCISFYLAFKQIYHLQVEIIYPDVGQVGQTLPLGLYFKQTVINTRFLTIETEQNIQKVCMTNKEHAVELVFTPLQRGQFEFPAIKIYSTYPFGLVRAWSYLYLRPHIWVAPRCLSKQQMKTQLKVFSPLDLDEFDALRQFKQGDSLSAISWSHVARGQGLFVKNFSSSQAHQTINISYMDAPFRDHEMKLSWMMALLEQCDRQQLTFNLYLPQQKLLNQSGVSQITQAKILLAQA